ncbi:sugar phosphate nucleotidyltransferase [Falsiroseomonas sp.]|uniref:sugar phosphate nucleotidyltransferase n=1 Tax=Falsiroseomonas sp. TaxID=2870721 RepID=UPI0035673F19
MWGIIPAAGLGSRIQPLAFSKELLPVGSRLDGGVERPRAVSEHLIERMLAAGVDRLCIVISPGKSDIVNYYGACIGDARIAYAVQAEPAGLCDAIFCAAPFIAPEEEVVIGLPDTIWFPRDGLARLPPGRLSFLLFPVARPELFDAVVTDDTGRIEEIEVKRQGARSRWVWGAFRMPGRVLHELHALWRQPGRGDEYIGTLVNAWIAGGGEAFGLRDGTRYVDVGTLHGWREAAALLGDGPEEGEASVLPFRALQGAARA